MEASSMKTWGIVPGRKISKYKGPEFWVWLTYSNKLQEGQCFSKPITNHNLLPPLECMFHEILKFSFSLPYPQILKKYFTWYTCNNNLLNTWVDSAKIRCNYICWFRFENYFQWPESIINNSQYIPESSDFYMAWAKKYREFYM